MAWEPEQIAVARDEATAVGDVHSFCRSHDQWVIEGCYGNLAAATFSHRPLLILLDPGVEACLENCRARPWEPHKYASAEEQDAMLVALLDWVQAYETRGEDPGRAAHEALFAGYDGPKERLCARPGVDFAPGPE